MSYKLSQSPLAKFSNFEKEKGKVEISGVEFYVGSIGLYDHKDDILVCHFPHGASYAGAFSKTSIPSHPVTWCKSILHKDSKARGLIVNSGCANVCNGLTGNEIVNKAVESFCDKFFAKKEQVFTSSTGVIGVPFDQNLIPSFIDNLPTQTCATREIVHAIETTDTFPKTASCEVDLDCGSVKIWGMAKGSGMIAPNMATMLSYIFIDARITSGSLQAMLDELVKTTFNAITVDSDRSTSDTVMLFATGDDSTIDVDDLPYEEKRMFQRSLRQLMLSLAKQIVMDGEGATKLITVLVQGSSSADIAQAIARSVSESPLVKTAIGGEDPNWGRILMAIGKTNLNINLNKLNLWFGDVQVMSNGKGVNADGKTRSDLKNYMKNEEIKVIIDLGEGSSEFEMHTCDLTHGYISINADYTT